MSGKRFVLDTSALLAWLEGEDGVERVRELLRGDDEVILPWPVLMELFYITARSSGEQVAFQRYASVKQLPVTLAEQMDEPLLLAAARFKAQFRNILPFAPQRLCVEASSHRWRLITANLLQP